jgi:hypothetical protein
MTGTIKRLQDYLTIFDLANEFDVLNDLRMLNGWSQMTSNL